MKGSVQKASHHHGKPGDRSPPGSELGDTGAKIDVAHVLADVGRGAKIRSLAVKWIWISTTKPQ